AVGAPVGGKSVTKNAGFAQMTSFVNKCCKDSQWNAKIANGQDHKKGITTIEAKLDKLCPYFSQIDTIYGEKQNVRPSFLENFGLNNEDNISETSIESNDIQEQNDKLQSDYSERNEKSSLSFILDDINLNDEFDDNLLNNSNDLYEDNFNNNDNEDSFNNNDNEDSFNNNDNEDFNNNDNEDLLTVSNSIKRKQISKDNSSKRQHLLSSSKNKNAKISAKDIYFNTKQQKLIRQGKSLTEIKEIFNFFKDL
ncbi:787_t:CDS:2, partial [Dentiscutata erythropus]